MNTEQGSSTLRSDAPTGDNGQLPTASRQHHLVRRAEALAVTGLTEEQFSKLVNAEVIAPVYLVWQVRDAREAIVFEAGEEKAKAEADRIGGRAEPVGRAYYRREELQKLIG